MGHPDTLPSAGNLQEVLDVRRRMHGDEHPDTLMSA